MTRSPITTHVLDTAAGRPAAGVPVTIDIEASGAWQRLGSGETDGDGRVSSLLAPGSLRAGTYRIRFETGRYFTAGFYPYVEVVFTITALDQHYHVPLLLSPFGYSTYRGS